MTPRRARLFAAFASTLGLALGLGLAELSLRLLGFTFTLYPTAVQFGWPDPKTLQAVYQVDRELLWVPRDYGTTLAKARSSPPTIVYMGDSCTQFGTYPEALRTRLTARHPTLAFSALNLGVGGWSSFQGRQQFIRDVVPLRPRIVTLYFGWNDHWVTFGHEDKAIGRFNLEHPYLLLKLSQVFRVAQLVNKSLFTYREWADPPAPGRRPPRVALDDFRANLHDIVTRARAEGITPILMTAPTSHEPGAVPTYLLERWANTLEEVVPLHNAYAEAVRDVAKADGVTLVDLQATFAALPRQERAALFMSDGIHLLPDGDARIASDLLGAVERSLDLGPPTNQD